MIVLLVEDDDELRRVLEIALGAEFEVRSCSTGTKGLQRLRTERVDVLLTDLDLPGTSGEALARAAKTLPYRVCVVTMSGDPARLEASRALADAVIAKPCPLAAVSAALKRAFGSAGPSGPGGPIARAALLVAVLGTFACAAPATAPVWNVEVLQGRWAVERIEKAGDTARQPPSGASFTAVFEADGSLPLQADCNRCQATYKAEAETILVGDPLVCTLAACPTAPLDHDYVTLVSSAKEWSVEGSRL
jgi:CheY-like chemotaxis protein/heat shock protein HslJ